MDKLSIFDLLESEISESENTSIIANIEKREVLLNVLNVLKDYENRKYNEPRETYDFMIMNFLLKNLPKKLGDKLVSALIRDDVKFTEERIKELTEVKKLIINDIVNINTTSKKKYESYDITTKIKVNIKDNKVRDYNKNKYNKIITWLEDNFVRRYSIMNGPTYYRVNITNNINPDYDYYEYKAFEKEMEEERIDDDANKSRELIAYADINYDLSTKLQEFYKYRLEMSLYYQLIFNLRGISINGDYTKTKSEIDKIIDSLIKKHDKCNKLAQKAIAGIDLNKLYEERKEEIEANREYEELIIKNTLHQ